MFADPSSRNSGETFSCRSEMHLKSQDSVSMEKCVFVASNWCRLVCSGKNCTSPFANLSRVHM